MHRHSLGAFVDRAFKSPLSGSMVKNHVAFVVKRSLTTRGTTRKQIASVQKAELQNSDSTLFPSRRCPESFRRCRLLLGSTGRQLDSRERHTCLWEFIVPLLDSSLQIVHRVGPSPQRAAVIRGTALHGSLRENALPSTKLPCVCCFEVTTVSPTGQPGEIKLRQRFLTLPQSPPCT